MSNPIKTLQYALSNTEKEVEAVRAQRDALAAALQSAELSLSAIASSPVRPMGDWQVQAIKERDKVRAALAQVKR